MRQIVLLLSVFVFPLVLVIFSSNFFILNSYKTIEFNQNQDRVEGFKQSIKNKIDYISGISSDYAQWDDSYLFMKDKDTGYIYENFRNESHTLENLKLNFMIYTKLDKSIHYIAQAKDENLSKEFKQKLLNLKITNGTANAFIKNNTDIYLIHIVSITTSDSNKEPNGYLYTGQILTKAYLKESNPYVKKIKFEKSKMKMAKTSKNDFQILSSLSLSETELINTISLVNTSNEIVADIIFTNQRKIYLQGKNTTIAFITIVSSLIGCIILLFVLRQKYLKNENKRFEKLLIEKTSQLNDTMNDLKSAIYQLEQIAYVDDLTGIASRRSFFEKIINVLDEASEKNKEVSFAMMDLDDFKIINDTYGHDAGDIVLQHFCRSCENFLDDSMILSRLGGEEFVIGFKNSSIEKAMDICRDIQHYIDENPVTIDKTLTISYTVSIGLANNINHSNVDAILKEADDNLYKAKKSGKNNIRTRK